MTIRMLAVSGSLREASSNSALVRAAQRLAPDGVAIDVFEGIGALPHFNPDLDIDPVADSVRRWRDALRAADAVLISTPEYAHGVPGALKNALDWIVSSGEFMEKPVGVLHVAGRGEYAQASLHETLSVLMAALVPGALQGVPMRGGPQDAESIASDLPASTAISAALRALHDAASIARIARDL